MGEEGRLRFGDHTPLVVAVLLRFGLVEEPVFERQQIRRRVADTEVTDAERHDSLAGEQLIGVGLELGDGRALVGVAGEGLEDVPPIERRAVFGQLRTDLGDRHQGSLGQLARHMR